MKYIKPFNIVKESFTGTKEINSLCRRYLIKNYTINSDGSIDVDGDVNLSKNGLIKLPLIFNRVTGDFICHTNNLISLEGSPKYVGKAFLCSYNKLTSLDGAPEYVGESFVCNSNQLTSLKGSPKYVGNFFNCTINKIMSFDGISDYIGEGFYCVNNPIWSLYHYIEKVDAIELFNSFRIVSGDTINEKRFENYCKMNGYEIPNMDKFKVIGYKII